MVYFILNLYYIMKNEKIEPIKLFRDDLDSSDMTCYIRGVGIYETMPPSIVDRPTGSGDWLLMYFHDQVYLKSSEGIALHPAGSWIIWSNNDGQYYGRTDMEWMHSWIHFDGKSVGPMVADSGFKTNMVMELDGPDILIEALSDIYREIIEQANPDLIILQNLLQNLLRKLARKISIKNNAQLVPQRILKIKNELEAHPSSRFTLTHLAKEASMSIPHFCAEFKKHVGTSPIEYQIRMRLQQARHLLYDLNLSISEIANRVGYNDIFHFSKQFKKHFGVSPSTLRK